MGTTKLEVYNLALLQLKEDVITSLASTRTPVRVFNSLYDHILATALEDGFWRFAMRSVSITQDEDIEPAFGKAYAHNKPDDWVRTYQVSISPDMVPPYANWEEESGIIFADDTPLYLQYVSNDATYGLDLTKWTARFTKAVAYEMALRAAPKAVGASDSVIEGLERDAMKAWSLAKQFEALREPSRSLPTGRWNAARFGRPPPRLTPASE